MINVLDLVINSAKDEFVPYISILKTFTVKRTPLIINICVLEAFSSIFENI
ncbi:hypothetical protein [Aquimarina sp. Aq78]|uniref:hypothetical protein n=1 Tax=Aquimarina sp. Aq78 TaxID=1191889 RepID=UPI00131E9D82|nr:hypothetical protein [Aquimarina sp. Aq78]